ncbi:hypothetical protein LPJ53_006396, partial [Coemansia erecta]
MVPAWDPFTGVIMAPYNRQQTGSAKDVVTFFDTRFRGCLEAENTKYESLGTGIWSISLGKDQGVGLPMVA